MPLLIGQKVVYRGTVTGLRISSVDGTAFIDNAGATIPTYADGNHQIEIYDSSNRMLRGVLKAAGSSETLGSELVTNGEFEGTYVDGISPNWAKIFAGTDAGTYTEETADPYSGTSSQKLVAASVAGNTALIPTTDFSSTAGALHKVTAAVKVVEGTAGRLLLINSNGLAPIYFSSVSGATWGIKTYYATEISTTASRQLRFSNGGFYSAGTWLLDNFSNKQVLTPSSSGATIVSVKGGTTYNFNHKNASFTYNAASYYVIIKRLR